MNNTKAFLLLLFLLLCSLRLTAQDFQTLEIKQASKELANIPGETMGQKLESLLFWSQAEKERRFPIMQAIFPSIPIACGGNSAFLKQLKNITPKWEDETTLDSYMNDNHVQGVIVLKDNQVRLEKYAKGINQETLWTSFSVAKSVSSMLVGVALKDGAIESLDDPLKKYITEFKGHDYGKVTVRQLLTMTSGIAWNEDYEDPNSDVGQMYKAHCQGSESHILTYMKPLKFEHEPGTHWNYSTGETDLVGILVQKATGISLAEYLSEKIWKPFGMAHDAHWLADECSNLNLGGSGLSASLRDFARIGTLMMDEGEIDGKSILSEEWLKNATSLLHQTNEQGDGYGYLWWRFQDGSYGAFGIFGQMIYINPHENLVVAQMAAWPKAGSKELTQKRQSFIDAIQRVMD
ncbi:class C beta-lactamase-related serine hydrolase [Bizionia argentinensis JUB59]|uniref:Class C beta-lactamase-related serine hydrolase n=1 Tax=Bizionia argentinensis JUB59 TaxID=1046627 RepID=G2EFI4_9FLAO|nr:serine hydrolase [Bizionia argentinensis]EGV42814.1 class C beta-lactamase-related serine hydrolase [Bizionia argentinensis JUB59]